MHRQPRLSQDLDDVAVHVPDGFDPDRPWHVVVLAHSMGSYPLMWLASGLAEVIPGRPPWNCWGLDQRQDLTHANAILVAPQFAMSGPRASVRWFGRAGAFRAFLDELLGETLAPRIGRPLSIDAAEGISLAGSSIGGYPVEAVLEHSDLADRVRNVVLFDAFYMDPHVFTRWLRATPAGVRRRFVAVHGGTYDTSTHAAQLVASLRGRFPASDLAWNPEGPLTDAVRRSRVTIRVSPVEHVHIATWHWTKVFDGFDLPPLAPDPDALDPKDAPTPCPVVGALTLGAPVRGRLVWADCHVRDQAEADDYTLDLTAGQRVLLRAVGAWSRGDPRGPLDTLLRVQDGARLLAQDDDGDGGWNSRIAFTAPHAGRYTVRVTSHGPWIREGPYTLTAAVAP